MFMKLHDEVDIGQTTVALGVCDKGEKHPVGGYLRQQFPYYVPDLHGLCIITGVTAKLVILDLDLFRTKHNRATQACGIAHFLKHNNGKWPRTPMAKTPNGGIHLYFAYNEALGEFKQNCFGTDDEGKTILVDLLSNKGVGMTPPTVNTNDLGEVMAYEWVDKCRPDQVRLASMPEWCVHKIHEARAIKVKRKQRTSDDHHLEHQRKAFRVAQVAPEHEGGNMDPSLMSSVCKLCMLLSPKSAFLSERIG